MKLNRKYVSQRRKTINEIEQEENGGTTIAQQQATL